MSLFPKKVEYPFNNDWRTSDLILMCKVTHCPRPRLLFAKVHFTEPDWSALTLIEDLTGLR